MEMMCGVCVSLLLVVNMLTETAVVKLKRHAEEVEGVAEGLARRLSDCRLPTKRRASGLGVAKNVKKWKELVKKKDELVVKSDLFLVQILFS
ncbi:unnamed protein product [Lupinus luteus]|uniref:Uncharacterized protein n=1 Tax=Lupinus luteus TaxID=3873 RepID=A0AAV1Y379_LUPLU